MLRACKLPAKISWGKRLTHAGTEEYKSVQYGKMMFLLSSCAGTRIKEVCSFRSAQEEKRGKLEIPMA